MVSSPSERAFATLFDLVRRLNAGAIERSEADVTRAFLAMLEGVGLHAVQDTAQLTSGRKRPDILAYVNRLNADLVYAAEVVGEVKMPSEIRALGGSLEAALLGDLWWDKFVPYVAANAARVQFFVLTSVADTLIVRLTKEIREGVVRHSAQKPMDEHAVKALVRAAFVRLPLTTVGTLIEDVGQSVYFQERIQQLFAPHALGTFTAVDRINVSPVNTPAAMEKFAVMLARIVAGTGAGFRGVFEQVERSLSPTLSGLSADMQRDLVLYVMSTDQRADLAVAQKQIEARFTHWRNNFVAASIHSLISRLFLVNAIEDRYCLRQARPLIAEEYWVLHVDEYRDRPLVEVPAIFQRRMARLRSISNEVIQGVSVFGSFFSWIESKIDPAILAQLLELFIVHDFSDAEGDLLGRFYEMYAQHINRSQRKELGQYFTPLPVVEWMWSAVRSELKRKRIPLKDVEVLDPATGSATFLAEAARRFGAEDVPKFWRRLVGFDIAPHGLGIAQANLYMAILSQVSQEQASGVGDLRLYVTDALDTKNANHLAPVMPLLHTAEDRAYVARHVELSKEVKRAGGFRVVIGNPPYLGHSRYSLLQMEQRFPALLASSRRAARAQQAQIRDDYAWFFAASDFYLERDGLLCFVTSDTYTHLPSYAHFRAELLRHFRIVALARLGPDVFTDVYRVHFAVILLEKRQAPLADATDAEPYPFYDLTSLAEGLPKDVLGNPATDPRLLYMRAAAHDHGGDLGWDRARVRSVSAVATKDRNYSLIPLGDGEVGVRELFRRGTSPLFDKTALPSSIVRRKWPGIATSLDDLLFDDDKQALTKRMEDFFALCDKVKGMIAAERGREIATFLPNQIGNRARLTEAVTLAETRGIKYDPTAVKRSVAGTLDEGAMWYPPRHNTGWIYYEPRFAFARAKATEGKQQGWGTQSQWRESTSHAVTPKLIYTTSTNPSGEASKGYRAFVVEDEWYVRKDGTTSQHYHYTGLDVSEEHVSSEMFGDHNNLSMKGTAMVDQLVRAGGDAADLLFYVASVYNSALAAEFYAAVRSEGLGIKDITEQNAALCVDIAKCGRRLRDMHRLLHHQGDLPDGHEYAKSKFDALAATSTLLALGAELIEGDSRGRYRNAAVWRLPAGFWSTLPLEIENAQAEANELVMRLYKH